VCVVSKLSVVLSDMADSGRYLALVAMGGPDGLPPEILSDIFGKALPRILDRQGQRFFQTIRSVSPSWRSISLTSPALWSSLSVIRDADEALDDSTFLALLAGWFSRAGPTISLELHYSSFRRHLLRSEDRTFFGSLIQQYQPRWRALSIFIEDFCFLDLITILPSSNWTSLDRLVLWPDDFRRLDPVFRHLRPAKIANVFDTLERLTSIRQLVVEHQVECEYTRRYGHANITELDMNILRNFEIRHSRFISSYPNLTRLTLKVCYAEPPPGIHLTIRSLLRLTYIGDNLHLLNHFTTPALCGLQIRIKSNRVHAEAPLIDFLSRCTSSLTAVTIDSHPADSFITHIFPALSIQPSLTSLTLDSWPLELEGVLGDLEKEWCPNLQELVISIGWVGMAQIDRIEALAAFLSRREDFGLRQLERLTIHRGHKDVDFPYHFFEGVPCGKLAVMVPLDLAPPHFARIAILGNIL
jgi:hypothetical protein